MVAELAEDKKNGWYGMVSDKVDGLVFDMAIRGPTKKAELELNMASVFFYFWQLTPD